MPEAAPALTPCHAAAHRRFCLSQPPAPTLALPACRYQDGKEEPPKPNSDAVRLDKFPACAPPAAGCPRGCACPAAPAPPAAAAAAPVCCTCLPSNTRCRHLPPLQGRPTCLGLRTGRPAASAGQWGGRGAGGGWHTPLTSTPSLRHPCPSSFRKHFGKLRRWLDEDDAEWGDDWAMFRRAPLPLLPLLCLAPLCRSCRHRWQRHRRTAADGPSAPAACRSMYRQPQEVGAQYNEVLLSAEPHKHGAEGGGACADA